MIKTFNIKNICFGEGRPKICVPLTGKTTEEIFSVADKIVEKAKEGNIDMVEFRGDFYQDLADEKKLKDTLTTLLDKFENIVLLFTIRSEKEGGERLSFSSDRINDINAFVVENKLADMVDVELFSGDDSINKIIALAKESSVKIIMSNHDFKTTPDNDTIIDRLSRMQDMGADIAKIAVMPEDKAQFIRLMDATCTMNEKYAKVPIVAISMGKLGAMSRIFGEYTGSEISFGVVDKASAPGQIPVDDLMDGMKLVQKYCI